MCTLGYKMKTCTQILDYRFHGKINVVSSCDAAKRASRGRSWISLRVYILGLGLALVRGLALLHINTPALRSIEMHVSAHNFFHLIVDQLKGTH